MRLILIRHGQSPSNILRLIDTTVPGPALTELGVQQAEALAATLADEPVDAIYASTMTRAQMTAEPLARVRGLSVNVRDGLRELSAGDLEGRNDTEAMESYLRIVFAWSAGDLALRMPGAESGAEAFARYDAVVGEAAATAGTSGTAVLVSHGAAIRMWVAGRTDNVDAAFVAANTLGNTGVVVIEGDPRLGWHVESWTDRIAAGSPIPGSDGSGSDGPGSDGPGGEPLTSGGVPGER